MQALHLSHSLKSSQTPFNPPVVEKAVARLKWLASLGLVTSFNPPVVEKAVASSISTRLATALLTSFNPPVVEKAVAS